MAKTLWLKNGKLIVDRLGRLILCDHCPCDRVVVPTDSCCFIPRQLQIVVDGLGPVPLMHYYQLPKGDLGGSGAGYWDYWWFVISDDLVGIVFCHNPNVAPNQEPTECWFWMNISYASKGISSQTLVQYGPMIPPLATPFAVSFVSRWNSGTIEIPIEIFE